MRNILKKLFSNELFVGSLALVILFNIGNVLNYIFHFAMARLLGPIDYGVLAVLMSIIYIFNIPTLSIQTVVAKYTTKFKVKKEFGKIKGLFHYLLGKFFIIVLICFVTFVIVAKLFLTESLGIPISLFILAGTFLFGAFFYPIVAGILQGMKKFRVWGWNYILNCGVKLSLSILLVILGFRVYGAIIGVVFGALVAFVFVFPYIKEVLLAKEKKTEIRIFSKESLVIFWAILIAVLMHSIDVILAKGFFPAEIAGKYAVVSLIGKIILFIMVAIGNAMFPISSEKFADGKKDESQKIIMKAGLTIFLLCFAAINLFIFFPKLIIFILFGSQYIEVANLMTYIGIAFSFMSFLYVFVLYKISIDEFKIKYVLYLLLFFVIQLILMFLFNNSIEQFSMAFMTSTIISFIGMFIAFKNG